LYLEEIIASFLAIPCPQNLMFSNMKSSNEMRVTSVLLTFRLLESFGQQLTDGM
jgi:hypothetical protein